VEEEEAAAAAAEAAAAAAYDHGPDALTAEERARVAELHKKLTPFQPVAIDRAKELGAGGADLMASLRGDAEDESTMTDVQKRLLAIRKKMVQRKEEARKVTGRPPLSLSPAPIPPRCPHCVCGTCASLLPPPPPPPPSTSLVHTCPLECHRLPSACRAHAHTTHTHRSHNPCPVRCTQGARTSHNLCAMRRTQTCQ
jgi:hypothetical protein